MAPLTNLLSLTKSYPDLSRKIKSLIIMDGGFNEYNTPDDTEFNFHADPIAVKSIFQSNLSIKLIPLDTTQQIQLTDEEISYIEDIPQKSNKK